jgi:hypothetical protein
MVPALSKKTLPLAAFFLLITNILLPATTL